MVGLTIVDGDIIRAYDFKPMVGREDCLGSSLCIEAYCFNCASPIVRKVDVIWLTFGIAMFFPYAMFEMANSARPAGRSLILPPLAILLTPYAAVPKPAN